MKVLGKDDETGGSMIVTSIPVKSTSGEGLYIKGFYGFNYSIDELNNKWNTPKLLDKSCRCIFEQY